MGGERVMVCCSGRFGLGFNAVYHFTDLPSFVSGARLVVLAPHAAFLPGASASKRRRVCSLCSA